jgi:FkbM family methyltransferase
MDKESVMIQKLIRLVDVLREPSGLHALLRWKPFSISSFLMLRTLRRNHIKFRTIIDAGANVGQFARASAELYPEATIYSIEALPDVAKSFRANLSDRPTVHLFETALGSYTGTIRFYPNSYSQSSSALPLQTADQPKHAGQRQLDPIDVPVIRLDDLLAGRTLEGPVLLKLDLQGFELEALKGAPEFLTRCDYVLAETVFDAAYEGEPLFQELQTYLGESGFDFKKPLAFLKDDYDEIYQMDAFFERRDRDDDAAHRSPNSAAVGVSARGPDFRAVP